MAKKNVCSMYNCTPQCIGAKLLVLGVLIVLNAKYAWFDWGIFVGGIIAIKGLILMLMPVVRSSKK